MKPDHLKFVFGDLLEDLVELIAERSAERVVKKLQELPGAFGAGKEKPLVRPPMISNRQRLAEENRHACLRILKKHGPMSRRRLAPLLGISKGRTSIALRVLGTQEEVFAYGNTKARIYFIPEHQGRAREIMADHLERRKKRSGPPRRKGERKPRRPKTEPSPEPEKEESESLPQLAKRLEEKEPDGPEIAPQATARGERPRKPQGPDSLAPPKFPRSSKAVRIKAKVPADISEGGHKRAGTQPARQGTRTALRPHIKDWSLFRVPNDAMQVMMALQVLKENAVAGPLEFSLALWPGVDPVRNRISSQQRIDRMQGAGVLERVPETAEGYRLTKACKKFLSHT